MSTDINKSGTTTDAARAATASMSMSTPPPPTKPSAVDDRSKKLLYGDLVRAIAFTVIVPVSILDIKKTQVCQQEDAFECGTAMFIVFLCILVWVLHWISYLRHSNILSFVGYVVSLSVCALMNLGQWPYAGECIITVMFQGVLVGNLCNGCLTFRNHIIRMATMFAVGSYVSIKSPFSVYQEDTLPILGGSILIVIAFLVARDFDWTFFKQVNWNVFVVRGARWVLLAIYMYHTTCALLSMTFDNNDDGGSVGAQIIFHILVKAGFVATIGVISTGAFQNEIDLNEKLEVLVKNRTKTIQEKNDKLHMVELALQASETAITITDSDLRIIWLNAACEDISSPTTTTSTTGREVIQETTKEKVQQQRCHKQQRQSLLGKSIIDVLALETITDEKKLSQAFSINRREDEICINGLIFRLEVSPYKYSSLTMEETRNSGDCNYNDRNNCDESSRFLVVLKNITAERAREVAEKTAQEETMLAKAMGDSMVTLTHELRTPMQGIMGVTDMLLQQKENANTVLTESLKLIMASSGLLLNLINNLLDVNKMDLKMMDEFPLSPVVARVAIQDAIDFCSPLASISGVAVVQENGIDNDVNKNNDYRVVSNSLRLQQILINLVSNAIKYTSEQSEICITIVPATMADMELQMEHSLACSRDSSKSTKNSLMKKSLHSNTPVLCFSISDAGPGVDPHQVDRLFRQFARLDTKPVRNLGGSNAVGQPSGTGLGLNLCQMFVQRMKGEIWATNNIGRGSTFTFFLPLATENTIDLHIAAPISTTKRRRSIEGHSISTAQLRVLLVDDVLINRKVIGQIIKMVGVLDIVTADSGENALCELYENGPYDLVITDLQMPGMSGVELCKTIMIDKNCPSGILPVVVGLTANTSIKVTEDCKSVGMSNVLYKPISVVEMREFFRTSVMCLTPGVWYTGRNNIILSAQ